jgi:hypothetical protein
MMNVVSDYDQRSLQHERRMLELYRRAATNDGGLLQPLANACWRASAFEWRLFEDVEAIRELWGQAARALAEGFTRKRAGFARSQDQLLLALHFAIGARDFDLTRTLVQAASSMPPSSRAPQAARAPLLLLEAYVSIIRAIVERRREYAEMGLRQLEDAGAALDTDSWRQQFPQHEATWRFDEHDAIYGLLSIVATMVTRAAGADVEESLAVAFVSRMDDVLLALERFIEAEVNHRPKLYVWLPGIALTVLAESAGFPPSWLDACREDHPHAYARLPAGLV